MASTISYGEIIYETSRAFADDEDEELDSTPSFGVSMEKTDVGETFLKGVIQSGSNPEGILCIFNGKVAVGFGQGYLTSTSKNSSDSRPNYDLLGHIEFVGKEGTVDSLLDRPRKKIVARILRIKSKPTLLFALIDSYGVPRSYAHEVMEQLQVFIGAVKQIVVFHNEPLALFQGGQDSVEGQLYFLKNNSYKTKWVTKSADVLPQPNMVSGISAAILTHCEMIDKPGLMLVTYCESDLVDSITVRPFLTALKPENFPEPYAEGDNQEYNLAQYWLKSGLSEFSISRACSTNLAHVSQSNLYI